MKINKNKKRLNERVTLTHFHKQKDNRQLPPKGMISKNKGNF
jgi:hypothetical protein